MPAGTQRRHRQDLGLAAGGDLGHTRIPARHREEADDASPRPSRPHLRAGSAASPPSSSGRRSSVSSCTGSTQRSPRSTPRRARPGCTRGPGTSTMNATDCGAASTSSAAASARPPAWSRCARSCCGCCTTSSTTTSGSTTSPTTPSPATSAAPSEPTRQRGRDSNPRLTSLPATAFKAVPIGHSGTPPRPRPDARTRHPEDSRGPARPAGRPPAPRRRRPPSRR